MMKNFPFWVVIFVIPLLAFLGEAASSHEDKANVEGRGILTNYIVQRLGSLSLEKTGIHVDNIKGKSPLFVNLKADACVGKKAEAATCQWNFGDGDVGLGEKTSHVFTTPGQYTIFLKITDQQTGTEEYAQPIRVVAR